MSVRSSVRWLLSFLVLCALSDFVANAQETSESADSIQFDPPLEAAVRKTNGTLVQGRLTGIDAEGITFLTQAGKTFTYPNNTVRTVRTSDGKFQYAPGKDDLAETLTKARLLQSAPASHGQPAIPIIVTNKQPVVGGVVPRPSEVKNTVPPISDGGTNSTTNGSSTQGTTTGSGTTGTTANSGIRITWEFKCAKCGHKIESDDQAVSQMAVCPKCGASRNAAPAQAAVASQPAASSGTGAAPVVTPLPSNVTPLPSNVVVQPEMSAYAMGQQVGKALAVLIVLAVIYKVVRG